MAPLDKDLIQSDEYPLGDTQSGVTGAQVKSIKPYTEESVKEYARTQAMKAMPLGKKGLPSILGDLTKSLIDGFINPMKSDIDSVLSRQITLNSRVDLLSDVSGYVCAYQSVNVDGAWSTRNTRDLPFKSQVGPAKNAHIDTENGMLVLDAKGLWTFNARCHAGNTLFTGDDYCHMDLLVYSPEGELFHHVHESFETPRKRENTLILSTEPVVIDRPGYKAKIRIYMDNWRVFKGGTKYSSFSAIRHSYEAINPGEQTVKSEAE